MATQKFSIDDPESWTLAAEPNKELQELIASGVTARFSTSEAATLEEKRAKYHTLFKEDADRIVKESAEDIEEEEISVPTRDGFEARALVYRPKATQREHDRPLLVLIHGGGFILGNAEMETPICVNAVRKYSCVAISLDYRLSPEVKFPVAYEDCWDALLWILANTVRLRIDPSKGFVFGGCSAGSHISISLGHRYRDEGLTPKMTGMYHSVPPTLPIQALDDKYRPLYKSRAQLANGMTLTSKSTDIYDQAVQPDFASPLWCPLLWSTGHGNLPRTFFQICGADLLRDEALIYERELRIECAVQTRTIVYEGMPHIFWYNYPTHSASIQFAQDACAGIGWLLGREI